MSPEVATLTRIQDILPDTRFYMLKLPQQATLPAGVVLLVDDFDSPHLRGGGSLFGRARIQVDIYAAEASGTDPYTEASDLADAIHGDEAGSGLSGYQGHVGGTPGLYFTGIFRVDRAASYEADERRTVRIRQDYFAFYRSLS